MSNPCRRAEHRAVRAFALLTGIGLLATIAVAQNAPRTAQDYLRVMDTDGDGRVSRAEYIAHMTRNFDRIDTDGNGVLEGDELPPGAKPVTRADYEKSLAAVFARQDSNRDGFLDARELAAPPR